MTAYLGRTRIKPFYSQNDTNPTAQRRLLYSKSAVALRHSAVAILPGFQAKNAFRFVQKLVHQNFLGMKNIAKHLLSLTAILLLASSFVRQPVPVAASPAATGGAYVMFAGKYGGEITKREMEGQTEIKVEGCVKDVRIFDLTLSITKNGKTSTLTTNTHVLTADMLTRLKSLTKGDAFEFQHTKAYLTTGKAVDVRGSKFVVV